MLTNVVNWFEGASFDITRIYRQTLIAQTINDVILSASPDTAVQILASRKTGQSMLSTGVMANEWIPIIRAVVTAVAIGMLPFLVLFLPTPLFARVLGIVLGFFIWLTAWGVTDAIVHEFALDYGYKAFEEIRQYQLGLTAIMGFGTSSLKTLAAFGAIRWSGLILATVITGMLIRFGGHALAMFAGQITSGPKLGAEMASHIVTPEGEANTLSSLESSPPVMANAYKWDFMERTGARTFEKASQTEGSLQTMDVLDSGIFGSAGSIGHKRTLQNVEGVNWSEQLTSDHASHLGDMRGIQDRERAEILTDGDAIQMGKIKALSDKHGAWQHAAQRLVDLGYASDLDEAMGIVRRMDSASAVGRHETMREMADARLSKRLEKRLDMSKEEFSKFYNNLANGDWEAISGDHKEMAALSRLSGKEIGDLTQGDMDRGMAILRHIRGDYLRAC